MPPLVILGLVLLAASPAGAPCPPHLFTIERSTNANVVVYDANLLTSGALDPARPVSVYWIMKAQRGQREELNGVERDRAYGFATHPAKKPDGYRMTFKADFGRSFVVRIRDGCPVATTRIDGRKGIVRRMFIQTKTSFFIPTVDYVEIFGEDLATGAPLYEKFHP